MKMLTNMDGPLVVIINIRKNKIKKWKLVVTIKKEGKAQENPCSDKWHYGFVILIFIYFSGHISGPVMSNDILIIMINSFIHV